MIQPDSWVLKVISQGLFGVYTSSRGLLCETICSSKGPGEAFSSFGHSQQSVRQERHCRIHPTRELVIQHTALALQYLKVLRFIVNMGRSHLIPTQFPIFLDACFDFIRSLVGPSVQRIYNLLACIALMVQVQSAPALAWLNFLGRVSWPAV